MEPIVRLFVVKRVALLQSKLFSLSNTIKTKFQTIFFSADSRFQLRYFGFFSTYTPISLVLEVFPLKIQQIYINKQKVGNR